MNSIIKFALLHALLLSVYTARPQVILFENGQSDYRIIIPSQPAPEEDRAAMVLNEYFEKITGQKIEILTDLEEISEKEILLGDNVRLDQLKIKTHPDKTGPDGFEILTKKDRLVIAGGNPAGTLNGVYSLIEQYLGCRFYSPEVMIIPKRQKISLDGIKDLQKPVFTFRETHFPAKFDPRFREWHKLHTHITGSWGMWVHTFDDLVPPDTYFREHPEYYCEINGVRVPDGQLCLTNQEMFDVLVENLRNKMREEPEAHYWSVSQNDNFLACQCNQCKSAVKEYGSESALMIWFVNRVAELFPDKTISTLAYQYTRSAPEKIKPLPNVNIMLCSIECNRSKPLNEDPTSASFVEDVEEWSKLTDNILIWDYVVQFRNYISPFPNLDVLQPNLAFFADEGCRMMFQQGSGGALSEFSDLRTYMIARLLWNPYQDEREIMYDFMTGYYGAAAPFLIEYIDLLHEELDLSGEKLWIYGYPYNGIKSFLRPVLIAEYERLFDQAEAAVANEPDVLSRVKTARLPLEFAILDISLHRVDENLTWVVLKDGFYEPNKDMLQRLDRFVEGCGSAGIELLNEQGLTPGEYRQKVMLYLNKTTDRNLGNHAKVNALTEFSPKYEAGGAAALTDGLRGIDDYHFNWLGFEGNDLEALIDLGNEVTIREVKADFLQDVQSWVFLPVSFELEYAKKDSVYYYAGKDINVTPDNKTGALIQTFSVTFPPVEARFIKVKANSMKTCPGWHIGKGNKSWIFTDEIVIK